VTNIQIITLYTAVFLHGPRKNNTPDGPATEVILSVCTANVTGKIV